MCRRLIHLGNQSLIFAACAMVVAIAAPSQDAVSKISKEPQVISLFPLGGMRGAPVEIEMRGKSLKAYAVWLSAADLTARVLKVEETPAEESDPLLERTVVRIDIAAVAEPGLRMLRIVTPTGVSNAVAFNVVATRTMAEGKTPHGLPETAQLVSLPIVIDGAIGGDSESDYYAFDAAGNQDLVLEILRANPPPNPLNGTGKGDVALTLYEAGSSFFDAHRPSRLAASYAPLTMKSADEPRIAYHFAKSGRYLLEVAGNQVSYQLRIGPSVSAIAKKDAAWAERSFVRKIESGRIDSLWMRAVRAPAADASVMQSGAGGAAVVEKVAVAASLPRGLDAAAGALLPIVEETQPNDTPAQAKPAPIPSIIEGAIDLPGDRDYYKFTVKSGERLAFEIETPQTRPPQFNPLLTIYDADGKTVLTNVYKRIGRNDTFYVKTPEPKVVYTFEREGDYTLEIRDATSRFGDPKFVYRILLRPQVPHLGDVQVDQDRVNIARGEAKKLNVTTAQEEEFGGEVAVTVEGLPAGVEILPATEVKPEKGPPLDEGPKYRFRPKTETASILLLARGDAPVTEMPRFIRVVCRPVVRGVVGAPVLVKELPLMVVK
jgi:hypothetical protein